MEQNQPQAQQLQIRARDEEIKGAYSNLMQILHTKEEFVLDFFLNLPPQGILASRVILNPGHAKRVAQALAENIKRYEEKFGKIAQTDMPEEQRIGFVK